MGSFSDVAVPSFIVLDVAVDGYFLPPVAVETEQHLLDFLNGVLNGSAEVSWRLRPPGVLLMSAVFVWPLSIGGETASVSASDAWSTTSAAR